MISRQETPSLSFVVVVATACCLLACISEPRAGDFESVREEDLRKSEATPMTRGVGLSRQPNGVGAADLGSVGRGVLLLRLNHTRLGIEVLGVHPKAFAYRQDLSRGAAAKALTSRPARSSKGSVSIELRDRDQRVVFVTSTEPPPICPDDDCPQHGDVITPQESEFFVKVPNIAGATTIEFYRIANGQPAPFGSFRLGGRP